MLSTPAPATKDSVAVVICAQYELTASSAVPAAPRCRARLKLLVTS